MLPTFNIPSRSTLVRTTYPSPQRDIASAVCSGSWGSNGGGVLEVFTEQNLHPRVQVSPMSFSFLLDSPQLEVRIESLTIIVAVAVFLPSAVSPPPQQSPMFGHLASSQTVCRFKPRRSFLILLNEGPEGIEVLRYDGNLGLNPHHRD